jgi:two-component system, NarL family, nitrate/nitrite response regulator NarL
MRGGLCTGRRAHPASLMKILLITEQPLCEEALTHILRRRFPDAVVGCVATPEAAQAKLAAEPAAMVIATLWPGGLDDRGLARLVEAAGTAAVIALDVRLDAAVARRAMASGVRGYIPMTYTRELIDAAIGVVSAGGSYFPQARMQSAPPPRPATRRLSKRQVEVLSLLLQGRTNQEIADALGISLPTVKLHVHAILNATGARNRTEAALLAKEGWLGEAV